MQYADNCNTSMKKTLPKLEPVNHYYKRTELFQFYWVLSVFYWGQAGVDWKFFVLLGQAGVDWKFFLFYWCQAGVDWKFFVLLGQAGVDWKFFLFLIAPAAEQSDLSSHYGVCLFGCLFVCLLVDRI